jgi:subtilisin family serine protease
MEPAAGEYRIEPGEYFVENQIIVTGLESDIKAAINTFNQILSLELDPKEPTGRVDLDYLGAGSISAFEGITSHLTIQLYTLPPSVSVKEAIAGTYQVLRESEFRIFVEPNYLIGRPLATIEGHDPWSVGGDPVGGMSVAEVTDLFKQQWAFSNSGRGIGLFDADGVHQEGTAVQVGVFDTSPFEKQDGWTIPWISPTLNLCVSHPVPPHTLTLGSTVTISDVRDHGLFVAGLIHAVAPQSNIYLIRVLNNQNQGQLFWLLHALNEFIQQRFYNNNGTLFNTVINLSLGVHGSDRLDLSKGQKDKILEWIKAMDYQPLSEDGLPVVSLEVMMRIAHELGAVVVAASGNDSCCQPVKEAQIPASYSIVIGVAASDDEGKLSCFSNIGDVAAPGGQGIGNCEPSLHRCQGNCPYGLIGLVLKDTSPTGYAYWAGTSFSTPLVSGLAALLLEKGVLPASVAGEIEQGAVHKIIIPRGPDTPQPIEIPIINLPNSLK